MITISNDVSVKDVQTAWVGVDMPDPTTPTDIWQTTILSVLVLILALLVSAQYELSETALALLLIAPFGLITIAWFTDRKANLARATAHSQALKKIREDRERTLRALQRGYRFIGVHYMEWVGSGKQLLWQSLVAKLNLEADDTSSMTVEALGDEIFPDSIPVEPELYPNGAAPYPLPRTTPYTFYIVTSRMLIVSPGDTCRIISTNPGLLARVSAAMTQATKSSAAVDIEATSLACADRSGGLAKLVLPDPLSSQELYFQEFVSVEYTAAAEQQRNEVVVTMRDGRQIAVPGSQRIADLVRQAVRQFHRHRDASDQSPRIRQASDEASIVSKGSQMKTCPMCAEDVKFAAKICRFCSYTFESP